MAQSSESVAAKKTVGLATNGGKIFAQNKVIAQDGIAEQTGVARELACRPEWANYNNGHIGFLQTVSGSWFVAFSGKAQDSKIEDEIKLVLQGKGNVPRPYTFVNKVEVHQDFKTIAGLVATNNSDGGKELGCVEKKLMSYFESNSLEPKILTMCAFRITFAGTAKAVASWVYPCESCTHCIVHYWNNLKTVAKM